MANKIFKWIASVVLLLGLAACSSLRKQADKQFDAGQYASAERLYAKVLTKDPSDTQAQARLAESRHRVIENQLLVVRKLRLSEDNQEALDQLDHILSQEREWGISPNAAAFATQSEEVEALFRWFAKQVQYLLNEKKFLKAKLLNDKYQAIFLSGDWQRQEYSLSDQIIKYGRSHCEAMKGSNLGPYAMEFVSRYCIFWGENEGLAIKARPVIEVPHEKGYNEIAFTGAISGLPSEALNELADKLLTGLKSTPFYDPSGGELHVQLSGEFTSAYQERQVLQMYSYTIQIPYEVMVTVPYDVYEPYTAYRTSYNAQTGQSYQEAYTDHHYVTHYRQDSETRYRPEERSLNFPATEFSLKYKLLGKAAFSMDHVPHTLPLDDELNLSDSYHEVSNAQIGLTAKPRNVPSDVDWLKGRFSSAGNALTLQVISAWDSKYCQVPRSLHETLAFESIMKCLKGSRQPHDFVENWFKNKFGLSYKVVGETLGFGV
jgi:hypothetical protein